MSREEFMEVSSVLPSSGEDCFSVGNDDFSFTTASTSALPPPPESAPGNDEIEIAVDEEKMTAFQRGTGSGIGCIEIDDARDEELRPAPWGRTYRIGCDEIEEVRDENIPPPPQPPPGTGYDSRRSESEGLVPRIYENWRGNNTFFLRGRMIFGPGLHGLFATVTLIVAPVVIFCAIIGIKLMDDFPNHAGISIIIVAVALTLSEFGSTIIPKDVFPYQRIWFFFYSYLEEIQVLYLVISNFQEYH